MSLTKILLVRELSFLDKNSELLNHPILPELESCGFFSNRRFTFVGVYYSARTDTTVIGYPKYLPEREEIGDIADVIRQVNLICQVIEQAQPYLDKSLVESTYTFSAYNVNSQWQYVNRYNLAMSILQDYLTYGIYYRKATQIIRNGNGIIQWQHTIQRVMPIIGRDVVYLDTYHQQNTQDYSQLITHLHIWIVIRCAKLLQGIGQYQELELPDATINFDDTDLTLFVPYLLGKLTSVFSDREVRLIKALSAWCGQSLFYRCQIGVTTFDKIWEYATKQVFGNVDDTRSGPPSYFVSGEEYKAYGDAIPDIIRVFNYSRDNCCVIGILDAKYYCPELDIRSHIISGAPANADISKQIGYYRYLKQLYPQDKIKFTNSFLFPSVLENQEVLFEQIGYVCPNSERYAEIDRLLDIQDVASNGIQDRVLIYNVNPNTLFKLCLNGTKTDDILFYKSFVAPFNEA